MITSYVLKLVGTIENEVMGLPAVTEQRAIVEFCMAAYCDPFLKMANWEIEFKLVSLGLLYERGIVMVLVVELPAILLLRSVAVYQTVLLMLVMLHTVGFVITPFSPLM